MVVVLLPLLRLGEVLGEMEGLVVSVEVWRGSGVAPCELLLC